MLTQAAEALGLWLLQPSKSLIFGELVGIRMVKIAKGKRPVYLENPQIDKLLAIVMALTAEVSVLHERLDTIERLLEVKGILSPAEIEAYQPDAKIIQEREQWRAEYIARVLRVVQEELETLNES